MPISLIYIDIFTFKNYNWIILKHEYQNAYIIDMAFIIKIQKTNY